MVVADGKETKEPLFVSFREWLVAFSHLSTLTVMEISVLQDLPSLHCFFLRE